MKDKVTIDILDEIAPRQFAVIRIKGRPRLACMVSDEWIIDRSCSSINEMLDIGLVSEEAVQAWVALQMGGRHAH